MKHTKLRNSSRFTRFFYERLSPEFVPKRHHARAYKDYACRQNVWVIWPFHYAVNFVWWLSFKWDNYRSRDTWIDKQVKARK